MKMAYNDPNVNSPLQKLNFCRIRPIVCGVESDLYVFGGYTDRDKEVRYFDSAAKFNTDTLKWHILSPMNESRSGGQACHFDGKIYLFGGLCSRRRVVPSCEVYEIATDSFHKFTDLPAMILDFGNEMANVFE